VELNITFRCVVTDGVKPTDVCAYETPTKPTKNSTVLHNRIFRKMGNRKGLEIHQICRNGLRISRAPKHAWRETSSGAIVYHAARCDADRSLQGIGVQKDCVYYCRAMVQCLKLKMCEVRRTGLARRLLNKAGKISHPCSNTEWRKFTGRRTSVLACDAACEGMEWVVGCVVAGRF